MFEKTENETALFSIDLARSGAELSNWSDEKRKDFCKVFSDRSRAAQYILFHTARRVADIALQRHFISDRTHSKLIGDQRRIDHDSNDYRHIGGRTTDDLEAIVEERAKELTNELPGMFEAWSVLKPDTAKKIKKVEELQKTLAKLGEEFEELPDHVSMSEVDQSMTIAQFRKHVDDIADKRNELVRKMNKVSTEGNALKRQIDKDLYSGNAELSKAVTSLVTQYFERAKYMDVMARRVSEKIMFGDNQAAADLLKTFEDDEVKVSSTVREEFSGVLRKLGIAKKRLSKSRK